MSGAHPRPDPTNEDDAQFWSALRDGELRIVTIDALDRSACGGTHVRSTAEIGALLIRRTWVVAAGTGEVWSFTVIHPPTLPAFADRTPYGAVVVRLDEGVFLVTNLVDCPVEQLAVGARVELAITAVDDGLDLPLFRRAKNG